MKSVGYRWLKGPFSCRLPWLLHSCLSMSSLRVFVLDLDKRPIAKDHIVRKRAVINNETASSLCHTNLFLQKSYIIIVTFVESAFSNVMLT